MAKKAQINMRGLQKELDRKGKRVLTRLVKQKAQKAVEQSTIELIERFLNDPITKEIQGGPDAKNISDTLGGVGNLFSYIGFEEGSDPISPIRRYLANSLKIESISSKDLIFKITFSVPDMDEIKGLSPVPWAPGRSWVKAMESGLSGLGNYLVKESPVSRSGSAIQVKTKIRSGAFKNTKYMSAILKEVQKQLIEALRK